MRVAIMGAGLAGLSCAIILEQNGVKAAIFEKRSQVGDRFVNGEIFLSMLTHPVRDPLAYLADRHHIFLQPIGNIKELHIYSKNKAALVTGSLGFSNLRGRDADSIENQLARQTKSEIIFNSQYTYEELLQKFTHVVVATGDAAYAAKIQNFREELTVTLKGATVTGDFDRYSASAWLNNDMAPKGYAYFIPLSEKEAGIALAYPDYPENREKDTDMLWERFHKRARQTMGQELPITDRFFEITNYMIGLCQTPRIGNTFFTGNCFGALGIRTV